MTVSCRQTLIAAGLTCAAAILAAPYAEAGMPNDIKNALKAKEKKTFYLKTNVPFLQGRHAFGSYKTGVVVVTPADGVKIEDSAQVKTGMFHAEARNLSLRVNDPVKTGDLDWEDKENAVDIDLQGVGRAKDGEGVIRFANLKNAADVEKCWVEAFSDVPLETKYDWPDDIKKMVSERNVKEGMNREQVMIALGTPVKITHTTDQGKDIEIWVIQRGEGAKMGFWGAKMGENKELEVRFADGSVVQIGGGPVERPAVKLK